MTSVKQSHEFRKQSHNASLWSLSHENGKSFLFTLEWSSLLMTIVGGLLVLADNIKTGKSTVS